jgi:dolichol-phosphate mannosyltransferase
MKNDLQLTVVLPAFNEQDNLKAMADQLSVILKNFNHKIVFVDDGSQDRTLEVLKELRGANPRVQFISFSRNFGHQNALKAGLDHAQGDCLIFMDCDLQHPPQLILEMIDLWQQGNEVVYTIRQDGKDTPFFKRKTASFFYSLINLLSDVPITPGRADFFLIDRKVADVLKNYNESPLFFRGFIPWVGFKQAGINYEPGTRLSGTTKYSLKKMFEFAVDGITSFSIKPLRASIFFGAFLSLGSFFYLIFIIYERIFTSHTVSGWTSILASILLIGGIQLIILGIIGEYLGKLFMSAKKRPNYIIREQSGLDQ